GDLAGSQHLATEGGVDGVTLLDLEHEPPRLLDRTILVLDPAAGRLATSSVDEEGEVGVADALGPAEAEAVARRLAPLRLAPVAGPAETPIGRELGLTELLEVGDPNRLEVATAWAPRPHRDRLRVTIGAGQDGQPVELDLKESAQDGMGPHGLLIG